jgi:hypothetical protein
VTKKPSRRAFRRPSQRAALKDVIDALVAGGGKLIASSAVVCLLVKRLSQGRKCLQPCCCRNSQRTQFPNRPPGGQTDAP